MIAAVVALAIAIVLSVELVLRYLRERDKFMNAEPENDLPAADAKQKKSAESLHDDQMIDILRDGPRAHDKYAMQQWELEQRRAGKSSDDIQALLDSREPVIQL